MSQNGNLPQFSGWKIKKKLSCHHPENLFRNFWGPANSSGQPIVVLHVLQWFALPWLRQECQSHPPPAPVPRNCWELLGFSSQVRFTPKHPGFFGCLQHLSPHSNTQSTGVKRYEFNDPPLDPCFPLRGPWPSGVLRCDQSPAKVATNWKTSSGPLQKGRLFMFFFWSPSE